MLATDIQPLDLAHCQPLLHNNLSGHHGHVVERSTSRMCLANVNRVLHSIHLESQDVSRYNTSSVNLLNFLQPVHISVVAGSIRR